jgi:HEAT repeat protein
MNLQRSWPRVDAIKPDVLPCTEQGWQAWFMELLMSGQRAKVEALSRQEPQRLLALVELLADEQASMAVRLGIGAVLEEFQGSDLTKIMIPGLGALTRHPDALTRADACHYLSLIGGDEIRPWLQMCLQDEDANVRDIASETLLETGA